MFRREIHKHFQPMGSDTFRRKPRVTTLASYRSSVVKLLLLSQRLVHQFKKIQKLLKSLDHKIALTLMKRMHVATCSDMEQKLEIINLIKCYNAASPPRICFIHKDTNLKHVQIVRTCAFNLHFALPSLSTESQYFDKLQQLGLLNIKTRRHVLSFYSHIIMSEW